MTKMSAKRHLRELQWRFMLVALFFIAGAVLAYTYRDTILPIFLGPLHGQKLIYLTPGGGFTFALLVSVYAGLAVAFPILLQQLYSFLSPALPDKARRKSLMILISSVILLVAGILFGYFVAVPSALTFLYGFADAYVESALTADSYTNFVVAYTIGIGIVFQVPLLLLLLHVIKPLKPGGLMKSEKWVVLGAFIVAAILTPTPDPINQTIMAGPVIVVYQLGVIAVLISIGNASRQAKRLKRAEAKALQAAQAPTPLQELASPELALAAEAAADIAPVENSEPVPEIASILAIEETPAEESISYSELEASFGFEADDPISTTFAAEPITESFVAIAEPHEVSAPIIDTPLVEALEAEAEADLGIERTVSADLEALPASPVTVLEPTPEPIIPLVAEVARPQPKVIDGFVRRPTGHMQIPQRPTQLQRPQPRVVPEAPKPGPARGFYVDGIIAPRTA